MTITLALGIALLTGGTGEAKDASTALVCFVRHEDNGRMNLLQARIYGSHGSHEVLLTTLVGGTQRCVTVDPGSWSFEARSSHTYTGHVGDPDACRSEPLSAEIAVAT